MLFPASISHIPLIRQIAHETWPVAYRHILSAEQMDYMLNMMYSPSSLTKQINDLGHQFYIMKSGEDAVGFISVEIPGVAHGACILHKLYVHPSFQGMKYGKALLRKAMEVAASGGAGTLRLNVNRHNQALHFYEKAGFRIIEEKDMDIGNGYFMNDFVMERILPDQDNTTV